MKKRKKQDINPFKVFQTIHNPKYNEILRKMTNSKKVIGIINCKDGCVWTEGDGKTIYYSPNRFTATESQLETQNDTY